MNGIDRVVNAEGYTKSNTVSSCKLCNELKYTHNAEKFLNIVEHILGYITDDTKYALHPNCFTEQTKTDLTLKGKYSGYKSSAKTKNKEFLLELSDFEKIIKNPCYICGCKNNIGI